MSSQQREDSSKKLLINDSTLDHDRWHRAEERQLSEKVIDARAKVEVLDQKLDDWRAMEEKAKRRKCLAGLRSKFRKPLRLLLKLRRLGDDVILAAEEGLRPYRLERVIQTYGKQRDRLMEAVEVAMELADEYPEASEAVGGFSWLEDVPDVIDQERYLNILTSEGLKRAALGSGSAERVSNEIGDELAHDEEN